MTKKDYNERLARWMERATSHFDSPQIREEAKAMFEKANSEESEAISWAKEKTVRDILSKLELEETNKWDDAVHCSCLAYVIKEIKEEYGINIESEK